MGRKEFFKTQFKIEKHDGVYIMIKINFSALADDLKSPHIIPQKRHISQAKKNKVEQY